MEQFNSKFKNCAKCGKALWTAIDTRTTGFNDYCVSCWESLGTIPIIKHFTDGNEKFNEPPHYHQYEIDTIEFLQKGFPPDVFKGFAIGSIIKYLHRHMEKGGEEDLMKAEDYSKRLREFVKKLNGGKVK